MSVGHAYNVPEPKRKCPYCGTECCADFFDNGFCMQQWGPYHCDNCHASEIWPYDEERELTEIENKMGWYKTESEPGSSVNQFLRKGVKS